MGRAAARKSAAGSPIRLLTTAPPVRPSPLLDSSQWYKVPEWISRNRGTWGRFPTLDKDPLFQDKGDPRLLPFLPPAAKPQGRGAVLICPGGNYEFLTPDEAEPVARWFAENLG